jgi:hypothetical protein
MGVRENELWRSHDIRASLGSHLKSCRKYAKNCKKCTHISAYFYMLRMRYRFVCQNMIRAKLGCHGSFAAMIIALRPCHPDTARTSCQSHDGRFATMSSSLREDDPSFARTSSGLCPDDGRKATTSWRLCRHDPSFARTSSGLCPDDHFTSLQ